MSCVSCTEEAKRKNREMDDLLVKAKKQALEDKTPKAICQDPATGLFIADARTAYASQYIIRHVVSGLQ